MSVLQILYPKTASREALRRHVLAEGFTKADRFVMSWPGAVSHFYWFERTDFRSTVGVDAIIFRISDEDKQRWGSGDWGLCTRSREGRSAFDTAKQNEAIRSARKLFGGSFLNDIYGTNRYTPVGRETKTPLERGLAEVYLTARSDLGMLRAALPAERPFPRRAPREVLGLLQSTDPGRRLYSALVPFIVALLERYFRDCFVILLKYDSHAQEKMWTESRRIDFADLLRVSASQKTIEDTVAGWYSFQNLNSTHAAFKEWLGIDYWSIIRRYKKVNGYTAVVADRLQWILNYRHNVIHQFEWETSFDKEGLEGMIAVAQVTIDIFMEHLELERDMNIRSR